MRLVVFSATEFDRDSFISNKPSAINVDFVEHSISSLRVDVAAVESKVDAVSVVHQDKVTREVIDSLREAGVQAILARCAGFDNIDVSYATKQGIPVLRVPAYSENAVAEHAVSLLLIVNRRLHLSYQRVSGGNFNIDGLVGFDIFGKTIGIIGTGSIGQAVCRIFNGFGCHILAHDDDENMEWAHRTGVEYVSLADLYARSDVISLHCPLTQSNYHMINKHSIAQMKKGVTIINTARAHLISARALVDGLVSGHVRGAGLDCFETDSKDGSNSDLSLCPSLSTNKDLAALRVLNNVVLSNNQANLTQESLRTVAKTTYHNLLQVAQGRKDSELDNLIKL